MAVGLLALAANAQTWTAPELPTEASDPVSGRQYRVRNVESGYFLAGGVAWYSWDTSTILADLANVDEDGNLVVEPLTFTLEENFDENENSLGWTFARTTDGKYTFISGANPSGAEAGSGEMHVDMGSQGHNFFEIVKQENGHYHIRIVENDTEYGSAKVADWADRCWGWQGLESAFPYAVYGTVKPADGYFCDWDFVDMVLYQARLELYNTLNEALEYSTVDYSAAAAVYANESATLEQVQAATEELAAAIFNARLYAVLDGASEDNPKDGTSLLVNPAFEDGNINGWKCTFVSGTTATNIGYQGASYTNNAYTYVNHDGNTVNPNCIHFIEAWAAGGTNFNPNVSFRAIGDAELSQTLENLPAGKYKIVCDAIANQQDGQANPVTGVQLFAIGGDIDLYNEISTGNGVPEHVELTFVSTGGTITLGLRTNNCTANWIAADNFELTYYGAVTEDPLKVVLDAAIAGYEATYPELSEVRAENSVKEAYAAALEAAKAETEDFVGAKESLDAAAEALAASVAEYEKVYEFLKNLDKKIVTCEENGWEDLVGDLADFRDNTRESYNNDELTSEDIAKLEGEQNLLIGDYLSANCKAGDDVTILLNNPGFDADQSGWTITNYDQTGGVSAGNHRWGGENVYLPAGFVLEDGTVLDKETQLTSGCNEIWRGAFRYAQTIYNMPAGLYTLSCKGFQRNEDDLSNTTTVAELFATIDGKDQVQKFTSIFGDCSENKMYNGTTAEEEGVLYAHGGGVGTEVDKDEAAAANGKWYPNGMCGASTHFAAGYYKQEFKFILTKAADIVVGARCSAANYWTLFDDFHIVYEGNDAAVYTDMIHNLQAEATSIGDSKLLTVEADNMIKAAVDAGDDAISDNDADACIAAIDALRAAIDFANETAEKTDALKYLYDYTIEIRMVDVESDYEGLNNLLAEIQPLVEGDESFESMAQVEGYIVSLKREYTIFVQTNRMEATEEAPEKISEVILTAESVDNAGNGSTYGWDITGNAGIGYGCVEIFNQETAEYAQTIYGLAPGYYRLGVQGFYRGTGWSVSVDAEAEDTVPHLVDIFAGEKATRLRSIMSDAEAYNTLVEGTTEGEYVIPDNMERANNAFEAGLYTNTLQFQVAEGQTEVVIGLRKSGAVTAEDWLIFDNWTLEYIGTTEPANDPTTAIQSVENSAAATIAHIYGLDGTQKARLTRGVNIIRMADGSVRKVLVK